MYQPQGGLSVPRVSSDFRLCCKERRCPRMYKNESAPCVGRAQPSLQGRHTARPPPSSPLPPHCHTRRAASGNQCRTEVEATAQAPTSPHSKTRTRPDYPCCCFTETNSYPQSTQARARNNPTPPRTWASHEASRYETRRMWMTISTASRKNTRNVLSAQVPLSSFAQSNRVS